MAAASFASASIHGPGADVLEEWAKENFAIHQLFTYVGMSEQRTRYVLGALGFDGSDGMELYGNMTPNELEEFFVANTGDGNP